MCYFSTLHLKLWLFPSLLSLHIVNLTIVHVNLEVRRDIKNKLNYRKDTLDSPPSVTTSDSHTMSNHNEMEAWYLSDSCKEHCMNMWSVFWKIKGVPRPFCLHGWRGPVFLDRLFDLSMIPILFSQKIKAKLGTGGARGYHVVPLTTKKARPSLVWYFTCENSCGSSLDLLCESFSEGSPNLA